MVDWKLVHFVEGDHEATTYYTPSRTIDSYKKIVDELTQLDELAEVAWEELNRVGARYAEIPHGTIVLVAC